MLCLAFPATTSSGYSCDPHVSAGTYACIRWRLNLRRILWYQRAKVEAAVTPVSIKGSEVAPTLAAG